MARARLAVIDLGSNSFRLVVFTYTDALVEAHGRDPRGGARRRGAGGDGRAAARADGARAGDDRAVRALLPRDRDRRRSGRSRPRRSATRPTARSSWRRRASAPGSRSRCSRARRRRATATSRRSTRRRCADGVVLDLGGGSMQLTQRARTGAARDARSWPLGAVRMTERFLPERAGQAQAAQGAARARARRSSASAPWLGERRAAGRASAAPSATWPRRRSSRPELPSYGVQGFALTRDALGELIERLAELPAVRARRRSRASSPSAAT